MTIKFFANTPQIFGSKVEATSRTSNQLVRYLFTGGTAAIVDIGAFMFMLDLGSEVAFAATCSFAGAAVVNYLLTSRFVFASKASRRQFLLFVLAATIGLAVNVGVTYLKVTQFGIAPPLAKVLGIGTAFLLNFTLNKMVVFRH